MKTIASAMRRRSRLALGLVAGITAGMAASVALAQTSFDQGYFVTATRDDPDLGPVTDSRNERYTYFPNPVPYFASGSAGVSRTDPDGTYFGSAYSLAEAQAGDRFVKASALSVLDFTTGATSGQANAIWSSRATPGADAFADLSVRLDRSLYFGDFLDNTDRGAQILDFANANIPTFPQAEALSLQASVYLAVQVKHMSSGDTWYATLQEDVIRQFVFVKDSEGNPFVIGGAGDRAYRQMTRGSIISGASTYFDSFVENSLYFDANNYPPRYGTSFSSIFGIDNLLLRGGEEYDVSLNLSCSSGLVALSGLAAPSAYSAGCDARNSAYWLGLDNFRTIDGAQINPIAFVSDTGLDLTRPSPSAPGGNTAVPEPATWALMIGGFGLAGAALRRRRGAVVA